jgi:hypothetical protein
MASGAIHLEVRTGFKMSSMRKANFVPNICNGQARLIQLLGIVAAAATRGPQELAQLGLHAGLGMTGRALRVRGQDVVSLRREFMAERAIGPESGFRIDSNLRIDMLRVWKVDEQADVAFRWKTEDVVLVGVDRRSVTLGANQICFSIASTFGLGGVGVT